MSQQGDELEALQAALVASAEREARQAAWQPAHCGHIDIRIASDGQWYYAASLIQRPALVRLFASVLRREGDDYFLVTPVEKLLIQVDDVPFVVDQCELLPSASGVQWTFTTRCGQPVLLDAEHALYLRAGSQQDRLPYMPVRGGMAARLTRSVYYQLAEHVQVHAGHYGLWSGGVFFPLEAVTIDD